MSGDLSFLVTKLLMNDRTFSALLVTQQHVCASCVLYVPLNFFGGGRGSHLSSSAVLKIAIKCNIAVLGKESDTLVKKFCTRSLK